MRITMNVNYGSLNLWEGKTHTVSEEVGAMLIKRGFAVEVQEVVKAVPPEPFKAVPVEAMKAVETKPFKSTETKSAKRSYDK